MNARNREVRARDEVAIGGLGAEAVEFRVDFDKEQRAVVLLVGGLQVTQSFGVVPQQSEGLSEFGGWYRAQGVDFLLDLHHGFEHASLPTSGEALLGGGRNSECGIVVNQQRILPQLGKEARIFPVSQIEVFQIQVRRAESWLPLLHLLQQAEPLVPRTGYEQNISLVGQDRGGSRIEGLSAVNLYQRFGPAVKGKQSVGIPVMGSRDVGIEID